MLRVLHVPLKTNMGGVQLWLCKMFEKMDHNRFSMDFLVEDAPEQYFDKKTQELGGRLIRCCSPRKAVAFARSFYMLIDEYGPYDIIHSHSYTYSGFIMMLAAMKRIPVRIVHSHVDHRHLPQSRKPLRHFYNKLTVGLNQRYATGGIGVSAGAAAQQFGDEWRADQRWMVAPCGIDLSPYENTVDSRTIRAKLGLPVEAIVIGHIGRFVELKNHTFILDVYVELLRQKSEARLLLIGEGPLEPVIRKKAERLGISDKVIFAGVRDDVPALLKGAIDVVLFPSLSEGLGLVVVEAQVAGVPVVASIHINEEANLYEGGVCRLALSTPASAWADVVASVIDNDKKPLVEALAIALSSIFEIQNNVNCLASFYEDQFEQMTKDKVAR